MKKLRWLPLFALAYMNLIHAQPTTVPFDSSHWDLSQAKLVEHLGRQALIGTAMLKDVSFVDGIITVDIASPARNRSYPGLLFRVQDASNYERIYIRPHRSPYYDDALQYAPVFNGVDSWQLYYGPGKTASLDIFPERWNTLKIIFKNHQAQVFWNGELSPALVMDPLAREVQAGGIGLSGPMDGSAFFANFSYEKTAASQLIPVAPRESICGIINHWELSKPFPLLQADFSVYPPQPDSWQSVCTDSSGLIDVSRYHPRANRGGDCILARTRLTVGTDTLLRLGFGYSDFMTVYLNRQPVYMGVAAYQSRDRSFLGIVGYNDNLFLPLKKGENELLVQVGERMGGWAFCFRREDQICTHPSVTKSWILKGPLAMPEAVHYDRINDVCYVSNYFNEGVEFVAKISTDGKVIAREWIAGLRMPTGMCQSGNTLYVVDRSGVNVVDITRGEITAKIALPGMQMPNDIAVDQAGVLYISDTRGNAVFRYDQGKLEKWLTGLDGPNALLQERDHLLVGQNSAVLQVNLADRQMRTLALFEPGANIDGIQSDDEGNYLMSDYNGKLYLVTPDGSKTLLLNTATPGASIADFAYAPEKKLVIIPTLADNAVAAYRLQ